MIGADTTALTAAMVQHGPLAGISAVTRGRAPCLPHSRLTWCPSTAVAAVNARYACVFTHTDCRLQICGKTIAGGARGAGDTVMVLVVPVVQG